MNRRWIGWSTWGEYHTALMRYLLVLDQGTTSSRALLLDERAALLRMAQEEHPQIYPKPGWSGPHVGCSPRTA